MAALDQQSLSLEFSRELLLLAHTPSSAKSWNVQHVLESATGCEPSAQIAQPFNSWIEKLWEQNGDGRTIASRLQIQLAVLAVLEKHAFQYLENTSGLSAALAKCLSLGAGIEAFDSACTTALQAYKHGDLPDAQLPLAAAEQEALACIQNARRVLEEQGFIEQGGVLAYLVDHKHDAFPKPLTVKFVDVAPLSAAQSAFFTRCADVCELVVGSVDVAPLQRIEGLDVRVAHASGVYAQPQLILNIIHDMLAKYPQSQVVITCKSPSVLFNQIGPALLQAGISSAVQMSVPFNRTDFGRTYSLVQMLDKDSTTLDAALLSDVLLSPLCGLEKETVWRFNRAVRGDRLMTSEEARALLVGKSSVLDSMLKNDFESTVFEASFNQLLEQSISPAYVREQQSAFYTLRDALALAEQLGIACDAVQNALLSQISFAASRMLVPEYGEEDGSNVQVGCLPQVRIMSQQAACSLVPGSVDLLVVCDLTTELYPLSDKRSAVQTLLLALGIENEKDILARERACFNKLLHVSSRRVVLERSLNSETADPLYPSAMLEELLSAYADAHEDVPCTYVLGEQNLVDDMGPAYPDCGSSTEELTVALRESVSTHWQLVAPHTSHQIFPELPRLSPSQIELYLDCPYKWFVMNRLGIDTLDEDLGPAQRGSFLHFVFQRFYTSFGQKVTSTNLEDARELMFGADGNGGIFAEVVAEQYAKDENGSPLRNRFVPLLDTTERLEFEVLKERVNDWLVFETTFLPAYHPIVLEHRFQGISFAGCELTGVIDRIDQDNEGHIVIIDYKGALKPEHGALKSNQFLDNGKIQTFLYAMLIDKIETIPASREDVVGSLYVSYKKRNEVTGAYRARYLGLQEIPTIKSEDSCRLVDDTPLSFANLLDYTADRIVQAVEGIKRGDIAPSPSNQDACKYCPVLTCEKRGK